MALFLSTFYNKLDQKGRVSVPATFRAELQKQTTGDKSDANCIIVFRSFREPMLEACGIDRMHEMVEQLEEMEQFSDEYDELSTIFAEATRVPFDAEGRVVLPKDLVEFAQITDVAAFVGRGSMFQIWQPAAYQAHVEAKRAQAAARGRTLPARRKPVAA